VKGHWVPKDVSSEATEEAVQKHASDSKYDSLTAELAVTKTLAELASLFDSTELGVKHALTVRNIDRTADAVHDTKSHSWSSR